MVGPEQSTNHITCLDNHPTELNDTKDFVRSQIINNNQIITKTKEKLNKNNN